MNLLKPDKRGAIISLLKNKVSQREIERKTGIDRKTIRKYGQKNGLIAQDPDKSNSPTSSEVATGSCANAVQNPPGWPPAPTPENELLPDGHSACEKHREWIEAQVRLNRNAVSIYQDLVEHYEFSNKYNSVKRFVKSLRKKDAAQFDRLEFMPGEEAQVDYGEGAKTLTENGKYKRPRLFVMTLKYSRRSFRKTVWKSSQETWAKLHEEAFRYFGGCPQYVVLDNLREGVLTPDIYEPKLNPVYASLLEYYNVTADPARVGDPDRKGTVECAIAHTQGTALKGRVFETIEEQNKWLMHWEENWAAKRIHGTAKRQVEQMFVEEKPHLQPLPLESFKFFKQGTRTIGDDGIIQVENSYYSALPGRLHSEVIVRIYSEWIEIIDPGKMEVIRRHQKSQRKGSVSMNPGDRIFNPTRETQYLLAKAEKIGTETGKLCRRLFEEHGRVGQRRMYGIINLARTYEAHLIEKAARIAIERDMRSYQSFRHLVESLSAEEKAKREKSADDIAQNHRLIRPGTDYAVFWKQHTSCQETDATSLTIVRMKGGINDEQIPC